MTVHLVGAGPGDPGLLTVRAAELLRNADVVVHDRLVDPAVLALIAPWAERVDVGKLPGGRGTTQEEINSILVDRGLRFECVVRLKGGDPFVFGRGGEEAIELTRAGIGVEVVPGISSSVAAPAAAGIPVTMRGISSGFTVITAHQDPTNDQTLDWDALANTGTTLVILMGAARAPKISQRLRAAGMNADTPVAIVTSASTPHQQVTRTTLADLEQVESPSVIVVGKVASLDVAAMADHFLADPSRAEDFLIADNYEYSTTDERVCEGALS